MDSLYLEYFPTEILNNILFSTSSTSDLSNLVATCHRLHDVFSARKLEFVAHAAEAEFGPLEDAVQLVTHNASQPAHIIRSVPLSFALLKEVTHVGRVAKRWEDIYPLKKWKQNYQQRRLLDERERRALRRALYRLWLYSRAFHNSHHSRYSRMNPIFVRERTMLLHNWSTVELAHMADLCQMIRDVLDKNICPSNGTISRKFRKHFPDMDHQLLFNTHLSYPAGPLEPMSLFEDGFSSHSKSPRRGGIERYRPTALHEPGDEGWGDDVSHYYILNDMLKLNPEQVLWLRDHAPSKAHVEAYVMELGEWFDNNGETFGQTLEYVLAERGIDCKDFFGGIDQRSSGVAIEVM